MSPVVRHAPRCLFTRRSAALDSREGNASTSEGRSFTSGNAAWPARLLSNVSRRQHSWGSTLRRFAPTTGELMSPSTRARVLFFGVVFPDRFHRTSRRAKALDERRRRANDPMQLPGLSFRWSVSRAGKRLARDRSCHGLFLPQGFRASRSRLASARIRQRIPSESPDPGSRSLESPSARELWASFPQTVVAGEPFGPANITSDPVHLADGRKRLFFSVL